MNVAVVGTGYVGLVTGTCLAETANSVTCVDNNPDKLALLQRGGIPIFEPGLDVLVKKNTAAGRLSFTGDLAAAVRGARLIFVAVGTPELPNGDVDLKDVNAVVDGICAALKDVPKGNPGDRVVVLKSTVPPGTNRAVTDRMIANGCAHIEVASNPEFLKEGAAIDDFMTPDRVVAGVRHEAVGEALRELYIRLSRPDAAKAVRVVDVRIGGIDYGATAALLTARPDVRGVVGLPAEEAARVMQANGFRVWREESGSDGRPRLLARLCEEPGLDAGVVRLTAGVGADGRVTDLALGDPAAYDIALGILPGRGVPFADQPGAYLLLPVRAATLATVLFFGAPLMMR